MLVYLLIACLIVCHAQRSTFYSFNPPNGEKYIALTFDDGPHQTLTPKLLDSLKEKGAKATFFVMGIKVEQHADILRRAVEEGHEIANHVWDHPVLSPLTAEQVHDQLDRTNVAIYNAIRKYPTVMRPPYGNTIKKLNNYITSTEKLDVIMWSLDTLDWQRPSPDDIVKRVTQKAKPGTIILCHDIHPGTVEAIPKMVDAMKALGFTFLTVSEMADLQRKKPKRLLRGSEE